MLIRDSSLLFAKDNYIFFSCFDTIDEVTLIGLNVDLDCPKEDLLKVERVSYAILNDKYKMIEPFSENYIQYKNHYKAFCILNLCFCFDNVKLMSNKLLSERNRHLFSSLENHNLLLSYNNKRKPYILSTLSKDDLKGRYVTSCFVDENSNLCIQIEYVGKYELAKKEGYKPNQKAIEDNVNKGLTFIYNFRENKKDLKFSSKRSKYKRLGYYEITNSFLSSKLEIELLKHL